MSYVIQKLKEFPVQFGSLILFLSGYQLSGNSTIRENGTPDGKTVLSGYWGHGIRLKLKGRISPDQSIEKIILALSQNLLKEQNFILDKLSFQNAMLCNYTLTDEQDTPEISLLFYCPENPVIQEEISS